MSGSMGRRGIIGPGRKKPSSSWAKRSTTRPATLRRTTSSYLGLGWSWARSPGIRSDLSVQSARRVALHFSPTHLKPPPRLFGEPDLSWVDWQVDGYTGLELWNAMSEFKSLLRSRLHALYYAFAPDRIARGPSKETLAKWDDLLLSGRRVVAIGGTDAHAFRGKMGPFKRTIFPYTFHFRTVNTHLLVERPLGGDLDQDRQLVYDALRAGRAFIGYDLPAPTRGFNFTAQGKDKPAWMGDEISAKNGVTFQIRLPRRAECHLLKNGQVVKSWRQRETCTHITSESGVYRVEVFIPYRGRRRGWIFSNPIYVR